MAVPTLQITVDWNRDGLHTGTYDDITGDVQSVTYTAGANFDGSSEGPGSCSLVIYNEDAKYTPDNTASPIYRQLKPGRRLWIRATYASVTYALFYGTIRRIVPHPADRTAEIYAEDPLFELDRAEVNVAASVSRSIRAFRELILYDAGVPPSDLAYGIETNTPPTYADHVMALGVLEELNRATGSTHYIHPYTVAATPYLYQTINRTTLATRVSSATWDDDLTDADGFDLTDEAVYNAQRVTAEAPALSIPKPLWEAEAYIDLPALGSTTIWATWSDPALNVTAAATTASGSGTLVTTPFGDSAKIVLTAGAGGWSISSLVVSGQALEVRDTRSVLVSDAASATEYGTRFAPDVSSRYIESDAAAAGLASWTVYRYKDGPSRPTVTRENAFPSQLSHHVGDVITLNFPLLSITGRRYFIRSTTTTISASSTVWRTTYALESATPLFEMRDDFERADRIGLGTSPSGHVWTMHGSASSLATAGIYSGRFTHTTGTASYGMVDVGAAPERMTAKASFTGTFTGQSIALVPNPVGPVNTQASRYLLHLVFTPTGVFNLSFYDNNIEYPGLIGTFPALTAGTVYSFGLRVNGNTATIEKPDGTEESITNARVGALHGRYLFWEPYSDAGNPVPRFESVAATRGSYVTIGGTAAQGIGGDAIWAY